MKTIINSIEVKVAKLIEKSNQLRLEKSELQKNNDNLNAKLQQQEEQLLQYQEEITDWTEKYDTLKTVNSMLGSDENKRETKLKINALVREIDHCIAQLSE